MDEVGNAVEAINMHIVETVKEAQKRGRFKVEQVIDANAEASVRAAQVKFGNGQSWIHLSTTRR